MIFIVQLISIRMMRAINRVTTITIQERDTTMISMLLQLEITWHLEMFYSIFLLTCMTDSKRKDKTRIDLMRITINRKKEHLKLLRIKLLISKMSRRRIRAIVEIKINQDKKLSSTWMIDQGRHRRNNPSRKTYLRHFFLSNKHMCLSAFFLSWKIDWKQHL